MLWIALQCTSETQEPESMSPVVIGSRHPFSKINAGTKYYWHLPSEPEIGLLHNYILRQFKKLPSG